jgi:glycosyltransferase involved in cell wall biosynthesis
VRILIVTDYYQSKINYAKSIVAQLLHKQGHVVAVVTSDRYFPFHNYTDTAGKVLGKRVQSSGIKRENGITVYRQNTMFDFFARSFFVGIEQRLRQFKPDIIIVFGMASFSATQVARIRKKYPTITKKLIVADSHLPSELALGNSIVKKLFYSLFRWLWAPLISSTCDQFIALQDDTVLVAHNTYGISRYIKVVPNGTDTSMYYFSSPSRKKIRKKFGMKNNDYAIIYTGKIVPSKGIDILMKALVPLWKKNIPAYCLLVGDGPTEYKEKCLQLVSPKFRQYIHITGMLKPEELYEYYSAADVGVWPLQESLAMVDAAACRLPFIANNTLGARERISNNNAILYKKGSWIDLSRKLEYLYKNHSLRKKMGNNGLQLVVKELQWEKLVKAYITS